MIDNKNLVLAIALSVAILFGFELYFKETRPPLPPEGQKTEQTAGPSAVPGTSAPSAPSASSMPAATRSQAQAPHRSTHPAHQPL